MAWKDSGLIEAIIVYPLANRVRISYLRKTHPNPNPNLISKIPVAPVVYCYGTSNPVFVLDFESLCCRGILNVFANIKRIKC